MGLEHLESRLVLSHASALPIDDWIPAAGSAPQDGGTGELVIDQVHDLSFALQTALGDLDGDGDLDAVATTAANQHNLIFINDGDRNLSPAGQTLGESEGAGLELGDLDGDGDVDVVFTGRSNLENDSIWLNDGAGNFVSMGVSIDGASIDLGDLDGDGDLDAFVGRLYGTNAVWLNDGDGLLVNSGQELGDANDASRGVALGDLDGDGDLDAFVANDRDPNRVWINDGAAVFSDSGQELSGPGRNEPGSEAVALGDIDGDGDLDAFVANDRNELANRIWLNDGAATFTASPHLLPEFVSRSIALGDLDGDGDLDALVGNDGGAGSFAYFNDGAGRFARGAFGLGRLLDIRDVALGDIDRDGDLDAVVANYSSGADGHIGVWLNADGKLSVQTSPTATQAPVDAVETVQWEVVVANRALHTEFDVEIADAFADDLDNVRLLEVLAVGPTTTSNLSPGPLNDELRDTVAIAAGGSVAYRLQGDLTGQPGGPVEFHVATANLAPGRLESNLANNRAASANAPQATVGGTGLLTIESLASARYSARSVDIGDLDRDGDLDAFVGGSNAVFLNDGSGRFFINQIGEDPSEEAVLSDVDGDGDLDAVVGLRDFGVQIAINDGFATFNGGQNLGDAGAHALAVGDVDGDGDPDVVINDRNGVFATWLNDGFGTFTKGATATADSRAEGLVLGDLDGDGDLDAVVAQNRQENRVWFNDGGGVFTDSGQQLGDLASFDVELGDVDGDGDLDVGLATLGNESIDLWINDGVGTFTAATGGSDWGNARELDFADLDADGDLDVVLASESSPEVIWINDGSGEFSSSAVRIEPTAIWGVATGDFDKDGDVDAFLGTNGSADRVLLNADVDLTVAISPSSTNVPPGQSESVAFEITVNNRSGQAVANANVVQTLTAALQNVQLENVVASGGAVSRAAQGPVGTGLVDLIDLPPWASIAYEISGDVSPDGDFAGDLLQTVTATPPAGLVDFNVGNNSARADNIVQPAAGGTNLFYAGGSVPQQNNDVSIELGDLDRDGDLDAFVANEIGEHRVFLRDAAGEFIQFGQTRPRSEIPFSDGKLETHLADIDGDGDLDVLITWAGIEILVNLGNGEFVAGPQRILGVDEASLADIDGDGDLDLLTTSDRDALGPTHAIWLNDGGGVFTNSGRRFTPDRNLYGLAAGDLDGDGDVDVFAVDRDSDRVWLNNGRGEFSATSQVFDAELSNTDVALGDLDGDGDLDAATAGMNGRNRFWLNNGDGTFVDGGQLESGRQDGEEVQIADMDGDGDLDVVVLSESSPGSRVAVWINDSRAGFTLTGALPAVELITDFDLGDVDADGDTDIAFLRENFFDVSGNNVWLNADGDLAIEISPPTTTIAAGTASTVEYVLTVSNPTGADVTEATVLADFSAELSNVELVRIESTTGAFGNLSPGGVSGQLADLVDLPAGGSIAYTLTGLLTVPSATTDLQAAVTAAVALPADVVDGNLANNTTRTFNQPPITLPPSTIDFVDTGQTFSFANVYELAAGDIDRDGLTDLLAAGNDNRVHLLTSIGDGQFSEASLPPTNGQTNAISVGDVDGDGDLDAAIANQSATFVWFNDSAGGFFDSGQQLGNGALDAELADLDGDGDLDLLIANGNNIEIWQNAGAGVFSLGDVLVDAAARNIDVGDVDGDGDLDVLSTEQGAHIWLNDGDGQFALAAHQMDVRFVLDGKLADFDSDGDLDAAFVFDRGSENVLWLNDGDGVFSAAADSLTSVRGRAVAVADIDGDGDVDLAVGGRSTNNKGRLFLNRGDGQFVLSNQDFVRTFSVAVAFGDFDGDADLDVAWDAFDQGGVNVLLNTDADLALQTSPTTHPSIGDESGVIAYRLTATNRGPRAVAGATITDVLAPEFSDVVVTQVTTLGGANSNLAAGPLVGPMVDTVVLPAGASVVYSIEATFANLSGLANRPTHVAEIIAPVAILESTLHNNRVHGGLSTQRQLVVSSGSFVDSGQAPRTFGEGVALSDLDGDGDLDAFVASDDDAGHRVMINRGGGRFEEVARLEADRATAVVVGDVDMDGDQDAITTSAGGEARRLWLNDGDGGFEEGDRLTAFSQIAALRLGDLDGDGDLDAFAPRTGRQGNRVLLNDGFGHFIDTGQILGNQNSTDARLIDFDGDGDLDAVVGNYGPNRVWLNNGDAQFADLGIGFGDASTQGIAVGDFSGAGQVEILAANRGQESMLWRRNIREYFGTPLPRGDNDPFGLQVGDLDGDGDLDALFTGVGRVLINDGAGNFSEGPPQPDGFAQRAALGDLDGDGDLDAYLTAGADGFDAVWLNAETDLRLQFTEQPLKETAVRGDLRNYRFVVANGGPQSVEAAALNIRLPESLTTAQVTEVTASAGASTTLAPGPIGNQTTVAIDLGIGDFVEVELTVNVAAAGAPGQRPEAIASVSVSVDLPDSQIDSNRRDNVIIDSDVVSATALRGAGVLIDSQQRLGDRSTYALALGDVDGDGDLDALVGNAGDVGSYTRLWLNSGNGEFIDSEQAFDNIPVRSLAMADVDGDGDLDAFLGNSNSGVPKPTLFLNDGDGGFSAADRGLLTRSARMVSLADLDGDGDVDATIDGRIYLNDGSGRFSDSGRKLAADRSFAPAYGDVDGDGDLDVLFGNQLDVNQGGGVFEPSDLRLGNQAGARTKLADFNNDGHLDAWLPSFDGNTVWLGDGNGSFSDTGQLIGAADSLDVSLGDVDGDGDLDAITYVVGSGSEPHRPAIWLNDGDGLFSPNGQLIDVFDIRVGAIADLDGDGDLDAFFGSDSGANQVWLNPNEAAQVDLGVEVSNNATSVRQGDQITYSIVVANQGPGSADSADVTAQLPRELLNAELVRVEIVGGSSAQATPGPIVETFADEVSLPSGGSIIYQIRGTVAPSLATPSWLTVAAEVAPVQDVIDPFIADNRSVDGDIVLLQAQDGSGVFRKSDELGSLGEAVDVGLADLDADGDLDAVVVYDEGKDEILLNNGDGTFVDGGPLSPDEFRSIAVALADVENDGDVDIFVSHGSGPSRIWLNNGDGVFVDSGQRISFTNDPPAGFATLVDITSDGFVDLVGGSEFFANDGNGVFVDNDTTLFSRINNTAYGDVDHDGDIDAVGIGQLLLNDGAGLLVRAGERFEDTSPPWTLGDLDGDGDLDAIRSGGSRGQEIWQNDGAGQLTFYASLPGAFSGIQFELADIDGDGDLDGVVNERLAGIRVWINEGNLTFSDYGLRFSDDSASRFALGDLNGDGTIDAMIVHENQSSAAWLNQPADSLADLAIEKTAGRTVVRYGDSIAYTITVVNQGLTDVEQATVVDSFSNPLTDATLVSITTAGGSSSSLDAGPLVASFVDVVDLPRGSSIIYELEAAIPPAHTAFDDPQAFYSNVARVALPPGSTGDLNPSNNSTIDSDVLLLAATGGTATFSHTGAGSLQSDLGPYNNSDVALGDLDGDGYLDAFFANDTSSSQPSGANRVLLNDGAGRLVDTGQSLGASRSDAVELGDIDGDGDLDAVVASYDYGVRLWINNGRGAFQSREFAESDLPSPVSVALGDLDGDGNLDAVVSSSRNRSTFILLNDGTGRFSQSGQRIRHRTENADLGDLDGDGDLDLFLANQFEPSRVWMNVGNAVFVDSGQEVGILGAVDVALGDVDGDGDLDAFATDYDREGTTIWLNDGTGKFETNLQDLSAYGALRARLGDIDGDGDLDALTARRSGDGQQYVWINDGSGQFTPGKPVQTFQDTWSLALGDLDRDGDLDAVYGAFQGAAAYLNGDVDLAIDLSSPITSATTGDVVSYTLTVSNLGPIAANQAVVETLFSAQFSSIELTNIESFNGAASNAASVDLSARKIVDLANLPAGSSIVYSFNALVGANQTPQGASNSHLSAVSVVQTPAGLFDASPENNRRRQDDVFVIRAPDPGGVLVGDGLGAGDSDSRDVALGDVDGDGDYDAVTTTAAGASIWINDNGQFFAGQTLGDQDSLSVALADLDGDGSLDVIIGANRVGNRVWLNDGAGTFVDTGQRLDDEPTTTIGVADFDGDGDFDFLGGNNGRGDILWLNDGQGTFTSTDGPRDYSIARLALGDIDGDGDLDVVSTFTNGDHNGSVRVRLNNDGDIGEPQFLGDFAGARGVALGDFDGDGDLDAFVAVGRESDEGLPGRPNRVLLNDGSGVFADSGQRLGAARSRGVATADVDNDGDVDAVVVNEGQLNQLWLNDGSGAFSASSPAFDASDGQAIALADLDGDGRLDAFVANAGGPDRIFLSVDRSQLADLSISISADKTTVVQGETIIYTAVVSNPGDQIVSGAEVVAAFSPNPDNVRLTGIVSSDGAVSTLSPGPIGDQLRDFVTLSPGAEIVYTVSASAAADPTELPADLVVGATGEILLPAEFIADLAPMNNSATDQDLLFPGNVAGTGVFHPTVLSDLHDAGRGLDDLSLGDVDGDGDLDAVAARNGYGAGDDRNGNRIWLNDGNGQLIDSGQSLGVSRTTEAALGDLDGDGDLDLFESFRDGHRIWINDGTGIFSDSGQLLADETAASLVLADIDADGDLDAVAGTRRFDKYWANDGTGQFVARPILPEKLEAYSVALGDLDSDGDLDLISTGIRRAIVVHFNDGQGNFSDGREIESSAGGRGPIALADVDGDGDLDAVAGVVVANGRDATPATQVLFNEGDGDFVEGPIFDQVVPNNLVIADYDDDGDPDIIIIHSSTSDTTWLWQNDGSGAFSPKLFLFSGANLTAAAAGDLDGDGDPDLLASQADFAPVRWLNENTTELSVNLTTPTTSVGLGDEAAFTIEVHNDGLVRTVDATLVSSLSPRLVNAQVKKVSTVGQAVSSIDVGPIGEQLTAEIDLAPGASVFITVSTEVSDRDIANTAAESHLPIFASITPRVSELDVNTANNSDHSALLISRTADTGLGIFVEADQNLGVGIGSDLALGDLDDDGDLDAFIVNRLAANQVWKNDGAGGLTSFGPGLGGNDSFAVALGDLDTDGALDAVVANRGGPLQVWRNNGDGGFAFWTQFGASLQYRDVDLADLDADGFLDALVVSAQGAQLWRGLGNGAFASVGPTFGDGRFVAGALGDVDGDGDLDAYLASSLAMDQGGPVQQIWLNDASGHFARSNQPLGRQAAMDAAFADFDGDGDIDLFVANRNAANEIWLNDSTGQFTRTPQSLGNSRSTKVALGDLDGDGDIDAAVANDGGQSNRVWWNDGMGHFVDGGATFGSGATTAAALGDIDSDGDLDLLTTNSFGSGNLLWKNQRSSELGDFNSDAIADRADLRLWQQEFTADQGSPRADADGDRRARGFELLTWQRNASLNITPTPADIGSWQAAFGSPVMQEPGTPADSDRDDIVDGRDMLLLQRAGMNSSPALAPQSTGHWAAALGLGKPADSGQHRVADGESISDGLRFLIWQQNVAASTSANLSWTTSVVDTGSEQFVVKTFDRVEIVNGANRLRQNAVTVAFDTLP